MDGLRLENDENTTRKERAREKSCPVVLQNLGKELLGVKVGLEEFKGRS